MNHLKSGNSFFGTSSYKNYKYKGKELQESGMYDYGARMYMSDIGRWGVVNPLVEKSRRFTRYNYAVNNPVMFTDPDGRQAETVKPTSEDAMRANKNTLRVEDQKYVQFDKEGNIDKKLIDSYESDSENFNVLKEMVNSSITVEYSVTDEYSYMRGGEVKTNQMGEIEMNEDGTLAEGLKVKTIAPNDPKDRFSSTNGNVQVYTNSKLDETQRALNTSHELFGHALLYIRNPTDPNGWTHVKVGAVTDESGRTKEGNINLLNIIRRSAAETKANLKIK
jgi:RHS repeat-associated protein